MFIRRILVPVDFSARSRPALEYACALAKLANARVELLHVVAAPGSLRVAADVFLGGDLPRVSEVETLDAHDRLRELITCSDHCDLVPVIHVVAGDAAATIVRLAAELPADLVVIGTRSRHGLAELTLGSVAQRVIACAPCPVIAMGSELMRHVAA